MSPSTVLFADARARTFLDSYAIKARQLFEQGGFESAIRPGDIVAVKVHMGEAYNVGYLRPAIVRAMVDKIKELGGRPFVTDTTTMPYHAWISRTLAIDYLETAAHNGFDHGTMGCPIVIADGWLGTDDVIVDLQGRGSYLNKQFIARAIADADALVSLAHFKGHPAGGFGGAIKNIGVGGASKRGKMNLHGGLAGDKPIFHEGRCPGRSCAWWETCEQCCPEGAIRVEDNGVVVDLTQCVYCFACANLCVNLAGHRAFERFDYLPALGRRIADSALACTMTKDPGKMVFINFAMDITPICDCYGWTDAPLVNDIGVLASWDPVALDAACIDLMNAAPGLLGSAAEDAGALEPGSKKLDLIRGKDVAVQIYGGVENGLGAQDYELQPFVPERTKEYMQKMYPVVAADKLKPMYRRQHPLHGLDTASFGRPTEGVENPAFPRK